MKFELIKVTRGYIVRYVCRNILLLAPIQPPRKKCMIDFVISSYRNPAGYEAIRLSVLARFISFLTTEVLQLVFAFATCRSLSRYLDLKENLKRRVIHPGCRKHLLLTLLSISFYNHPHIVTFEDIGKLVVA